MSDSTQTYDIVIAGTGAAGLLLAYRLSKEKIYSSSRILLIDKEIKTGDDRTWCFWEKGKGEWDHILYTSWESVRFCADGFSQTDKIAPYRYKMLRSSAFYGFLQSTIASCSQFDRITADILHVGEQGNAVVVKTSKGDFSGEIGFTSIFPQKQVEEQMAFPYLKQHFIGWFVRTENAVFDAETPLFMDFRVQQRNNTRFMYVLPFSPKEALVEYTLFSETLLEDEEYEWEIDQYLREMGAGSVQILEREKGNIPMTCFPFKQLQSRRLIYIGSAGGWTKASTGFAFARISQFTKQLVSHMAKGKPAHTFDIRSRYTIYDLIFLDVLHRRNHLGSSIFSAMFQKNSFAEVLTFLNETGTISGDLKIIARSRPRIEFVKSVLFSWKQIFRVLFFSGGRGRV